MKTASVTWHPQWINQWLYLVPHGDGVVPNSVSVGFYRKRRNMNVWTVRYERGRTATTFDLDTTRQVLEMAANRMRAELPKELPTHV